jgi:hypothetical protein
MAAPRNVSVSLDRGRRAQPDGDRRRGERHCLTWSAGGFQVPALAPHLTAFFFYPNPKPRTTAPGSPIPRARVKRKRHSPPSTRRNACGDRVAPEGSSEKTCGPRPRNPLPATLTLNTGGATRSLHPADSSSSPPSLRDKPSHQPFLLRRSKQPAEEDRQGLHCFSPAASRICCPPGE